MEFSKQFIKILTVTDQFPHLVLYRVEFIKRIYFYHIVFSGIASQTCRENKACHSSFILQFVSNTTMVDMEQVNLDDLLLLYKFKVSLIYNTNCWDLQRVML